MEPWYRVITPRQEVREGRSFDPSEFAIALERVVDGTAADDYRDPVMFVARTSFTKALREHASLVLRRLSGETVNSAPVTTLITQFGGGKTHTLTLLYHLAKSADRLEDDPGVAALFQEAGLKTAPKTRVAVFVGSSWDPQTGHETPWIDIARQLAGDAGVALLGKDALTAPPGTKAIADVIAAAGGSALFLFDEVLNCINRHRGLADPFHAFMQNLTVAVTGSQRSSAVISLPRSQVEMTQWDQEWQDRITKVVRRVAKDLIANDESEISEVIRKRLFDDLGKPSVRRNAAGAYADWCYQRRSELPPEWTAVDTATTEVRAKELLRGRFEACYPFHPSTLTVFQRKWQSLPQFQQTRGTLAMLAQWVSLAFREGFQHARKEPVITLGSAPLGDRSFRSAVLGQLGDSRLVAAIEADIAGANSHAAALDADARDSLRDIHRRVATTVLFESSGGQGDKSAHLPEVRFALGDAGVDTASIDTALASLARKAYYIRKVGSDGFRFGANPTLNKVVSDRRASLDDEETRKTCASLVQKEFEKAARLPLVLFPADGSQVADVTRLTAVVLPPEQELDRRGDLRARIAEWTRSKGTAPRLYPGALLWVVKKPGRDLRDRVETWLAWRRVERDLRDGTLGHDFERQERTEVAAHVREAEDAAQDEVWSSYRWVMLSDRDQPDGLSAVDLAAGHASQNEPLTVRVMTALRTENLVNESVGASYLDRRWPPALADSGAWPLNGLRQAFLNGGLTRVVDVDLVLRTKIPEFVERGDFGLAAGLRPDGGFSQIWFGEAVDPNDVVFEPDVFLLRKGRARALRNGPGPGPATTEAAAPVESRPVVDVEESGAQAPVNEAPASAVITVTGTVPPDVWNRLGTRLIPKLRSGLNLELGVTFAMTVDAQQADAVLAEIRQVVADLQLNEQLSLTRKKG